MDPSRVQSRSSGPTVTIELLPKQDDFIFSDSKYTAFVSGLGAGKTFAGCLKAVLKAQQGYDGVILAPTYPMLRDVTQKTFMSILDGANFTYEHYKTDGIIHFRGAEILLRSADNPDRMRGPNLNWAYLDEAAQMPEEMWRVVLGRLRAGENPQAWITTTPSGFNWVYRNWIERADPQYRLIHSSTKENTFLDPAYIRDLETNYVGEYARQEIDGDFVAFEGMVYPEFSHSTNVTAPFPIPDDWKRVRAIDYGYTNPFVCLWGAMDHDDRIYVYSEHYETKQLLSHHAAAIQSRNGAYQWTVADHDAQDNAEMQQHGIGTIRAKKDVTVGIQKVKSRLVVQDDGKPRLYIFNTCSNLIKEFGQYRWNESKDGRNDKEEPVKENDHAMDALRYMVMEADSGSFFIL